MEIVAMIGGPVAILLAGLWMVVTANRRAAAARVRMGEGGDRYFEEQRDLLTYPSKHDALRMRRVGFAIMALAAILLLLQVFAPS